MKAASIMIAVVCFDVVAGLLKAKFRLAFDGEYFSEITGPDPLMGGHIALRIRGASGFKGGCPVKDPEISGS